MANYTDGLSDLDLSAYLDYFYRQNKIASFLSVRPSQSFHRVEYEPDGAVTRIEAIDRGNFWINGGFFIFRRAIFEYLGDGEELVVEPFQRLIADRQLVTYRNPGFWACMDTFKEKRLFDDMYARGETIWAVWETYNVAAQTRVRTQADRTNGDRVLLDRSHLVAHYERQERAVPDAS